MEAMVNLVSSCGRASEIECQGLSEPTSSCEINMVYFMYPAAQRKTSSTSDHISSVESRTRMQSDTCGKRLEVEFDLGGAELSACHDRPLVLVWSRGHLLYKVQDSIHMQYLVIKHRMQQMA